MPPLNDMGHRNECCVTDIMLIHYFLLLTSTWVLRAAHCFMMVNISAK